MESRHLKLHSLVPLWPLWVHVTRLLLLWLTFSCHGLALKGVYWMSQHTVLRMQSSSSSSHLSTGEKNVGGHSHHHSGHGDHWGLWRFGVLPPQQIHWVGQVHCVRNIPQQAEHCEEEGQPAGDRAVLLHGESWGATKQTEKGKLFKDFFCLF